MIRLYQLLSLVCALCTFASTAYAEDDGHDKDRATITADYLLDDMSAENKDMNALGADLDDNFVGVDEKGVMEIHNKAEALAQIRELLSAADKVTSHTVVTDITYTKESATVLITNDIAFTVTAQGQTHTIADKSSYRDEWTKSGDTWLEKSSTETVARHFLDGKPAK